MTGLLLSLFLLPGRARLTFTCVLGCYVASTDLSERSDRIGGQVRGDQDRVLLPRGVSRFGLAVRR